MHQKEGDQDMVEQVEYGEFRSRDLFQNSNHGRFYFSITQKFRDLVANFNIKSLHPSSTPKFFESSL